MTATKTTVDEVVTATELDQLAVDLGALTDRLRLVRELAGLPARGDGVNPPFDECRCYVASSNRGGENEAEARRAHEMLIGINEDPAAMLEVFMSIEYDMTFLHAGPFGLEEFETFFARHNWNDPVTARDMAQLFDILRTRSQEGNDAALEEIRLARESHKTS